MCKEYIFELSVYIIIIAAALFFYWGPNSGDVWIMENGEAHVVVRREWEWDKWWWGYYTIPIDNTRGYILEKDDFLERYKS